MITTAILHGDDHGMQLFRDPLGIVIMSSGTRRIYESIMSHIMHSQVLSEYVRNVRDDASVAYEAIQASGDGNVMIELLISNTIDLMADNALERGIAQITIWAELPDDWRTLDIGTDPARICEIIDADIYAFMSAYLDGLNATPVVVIDEFTSILDDYF